MLSHDTNGGRTQRAASTAGRVWSLVLVLVCLVVILPAPHQAFGEPTPTEDSSPLIGAQEPLGPTLALPFLFTTPLPFAETGPVLKWNIPSYSGHTGLAQPDGGQSEPSDEGIGLTREEYEQFKQITRAGRAAPIDVALVNLAVKGTGLLVVGLSWLIFLVILRRVFDRWFDEDVYSAAWPSTVVIAVLLACTAWILVSVVQ